MGGSREFATARLYYRGHYLGKEVVISFRSKVVFGIRLTAKMLPVTDLLEVVEGTSYSFVSIGVESVEVYAGTAINTGVNLRALEDRQVVLNPHHEEGSLGLKGEVQYDHCL